MRRIVIEASDVLTVLKRERKPRAGVPAAAQSEDAPETADESASEPLPPDLAQLEDTFFRDNRRQGDVSQQGRAEDEPQT
jgi:hypothetical protein